MDLRNYTFPTQSKNRFWDDETRKRVKMLADAGELRVVEGKILPPKIGGMVGGLPLSLAKGEGQCPASACCSRRALPNEINQLCRRRGPARRDGNAAKLAFPPLPLASRSHAKPLLGAEPILGATRARNAPLRRSGCHPDAVQVAGEASKHLIRRLTTSSTLSNIIVARARTTQILRYRELKGWSLV